MKRHLLYFITAGLLLGLGACSYIYNERSTEKTPNATKEITSLVATTLKSEVAAEVNSHVTKKLLGVLHGGMHKGKNTHLEGIRIPFDEMLKANVTFTENKGQLERFEHFYSPALGEIKYYSKAFEGKAFFGTKGIQFAFQRVAFRDADFAVNGTAKVKMSKEERREMTSFLLLFEGSNPKTEVVGEHIQHTKQHYLKGNIPSQFITDVSSFESIRYKSLYKGVDLVYYNKNNQLKYDFIVQPRQTVSSIQMKYEGAEALAINDEGELEIKTKWGVLVDQKPYSYQVIHGKEQKVDVRFYQKSKNSIGFKVVGNYDKSLPLVIDPFTLQWATYVGTGTTDDGYIEATCLDNSGRVLGTGWTNSAFPVSASPNGYDKTYNGGTEAFVFRLNTSGNALDYVTFLGGNANETGTGIIVNSAGEICVAGFTNSYLATTPVEISTTTLTVTTGSINVNVGGIGSYGFGATILLVNGSNTMLGNITGFPNGTTLTINVTATNGSGTFGTWNVSNVTSVPFPTTSNGIQPSKTGADGNDDIFYVKLNGSGNNLIYGTYYGGSASNVDWALDLALDASSNAYMTGRTQTNAGFATAGVYQTAVSGGYESFVLKINADGTLGYCTYVGGIGNDIAKGIVVNSSGEAYIAGMTSSNGLGTSGAYRTTLSGTDDAFVCKLTSSGNIGYFTYYGGSGAEGAGGLDIDPTTNQIVLVGTSTSSDLPMVNAFNSIFNQRQAFMAKFNATGSSLLWSSYVGGDGQDNGKGFDYTTAHKNGGVKLSAAGQPVVVFGLSSSTASMSNFLVSPITYTAVNQSGASYTFNGGSYTAMDDYYIGVFDPNAQTCLFGMYLGGTDNDYPTAGINILQSSGCVAFGGSSHSLPFPVTPGAFSTTRVNSVTPDEPTIVEICLPNILGVENLWFDAKPKGDKVYLTWKAEKEINHSHYEIQRSLDGQSFESLAQIPGKASDGRTASYEYLDLKSDAPIVYYRLKMVDNAGQIKLSGTKAVRFNALEDITLSPNPGFGKFTVQIAQTFPYVGEIVVENIIGQIITRQPIQGIKGTNTFDIDIGNQPSGIYLVTVSSGEEKTTVKYVKE